jgi:NAD(P)-dependent dehydrogenase (short-subunit alcohol dehydrogenase family)
MAADKWDITGKVAIVTGGNVGIGKVIASTLLEAGCKVLTCSRRAYDTPPAAEGLKDTDGRIVHMTCDVREADQVEAVVDRCIKEFGAVDILVNNAGGAPWTDSSTASPRFFAAVIAINLTGLMVFSQKANNYMQKQEDGGHIINIASVAGLSANPFSAAYGAAKAGVINVTKSFAAEWSPKTRVNCVAPGLIKTDGAAFLAPTEEAEQAIARNLPLRRIGVSEEVADVVHFLATPAARYITGETIVVDGGGILRAPAPVAAE